MGPAGPASITSSGRGPDKNWCSILPPASKVGIKVGFDGTYGEMVLLREEKGGHYKIGLEQSGDYTIFIGSNNNFPAGFTLTVKVKKMADI